ncbi:hypothetical protein, partial [Pseudomonas extremaustralis]|uniref:hypothetical protein n=1 Tax=Pseudomonas extremaustralis TaxID=359110 RepID=UPI001ED93E72
MRTFPRFSVQKTCPGCLFPTKPLFYMDIIYVGTPLDTKTLPNRAFRPLGTFIFQASSRHDRRKKGMFAPANQTHFRLILKG